MRYKIEYLPIMILIDKKLDINQFSLSSFAKEWHKLVHWSLEELSFSVFGCRDLHFSDKLDATEE